MLRLWYNPRCSKSREALDLLEKSSAEFEVFDYLRTPPDAAQLDLVLEKLAMQPVDLVRMNEPEWRITGLEATSPGHAIRQALVAFPVLIQRPILETKATAVLCRPPERVLELL